MSNQLNQIKVPSGHSRTQLQSNHTSTQSNTNKRSQQMSQLQQQKLLSSKQPFTSSQLNNHQPLQQSQTIGIVKVLPDTVQSASNLAAAHRQQIENSQLQQNIQTTTQGLGSLKQSPTASHKTAALMHQQQQMRSRPSSNKRQSMKSTVSIASPTLPDRNQFPNSVQQALQASQSMTLTQINQNMSQLAAGHARNLPNKICSSISTDNGPQNHSAKHNNLQTSSTAIINGETANLNSMSNLGGTNHTNNNALAQTLKKMESYEELSAYTDVYQHQQNTNSQISNSQLASQLTKLGGHQHHSRTYLNSNSGSGSSNMQVQQLSTVTQSIKGQVVSSSAINIKEPLSAAQQQSRLSPKQALIGSGAASQSSYSTINTLSKHVLVAGGKQNGGGVMEEEMPPYSQIGNQDSNRKVTNPPATLSGHPQQPGPLPSSHQHSSGMIISQDKSRRNYDQKISRTSERIALKKRPCDEQQTVNANTGANVPVTQQSNNATQSNAVPTLLNKLVQNEEERAQIYSQKELLHNDELNLTSRQDEESILEFLDQKDNNLLGRIGVYKINFNKNLRRFQELAADQAKNLPNITEIANMFLNETLLPSIWQVASLGQSTKFFRQQKTMKNNDAAGQQSPSIGSPDRCDIQSEATITAQPQTITLNSTQLPLQINFNPLMITFCLFLRALSDLTMPSTQPDQEQLEESQIIMHCLARRKKIISKLYQIQIKAVNVALQSLDMQSVTSDGQPAKVIEFIKKWVAKEKVLINHCVKQLVVPPLADKEQQLALLAQNLSQSKGIVDSQNYLERDLAAKKNREQLDSRVYKGGVSRKLKEQSQQNNQVNNGQFSHLNSSKESEDFIETKNQHKGGRGGALFDGGGMTQENFYKAPTDVSPWKPGDHSGSQPRNQLPTNAVHQTKSLQQKVSRHRETQHRNLFVEYHQLGSQKQTIFKEPQMALSSTNFNKNHSNSLIQIKIQQQNHVQQPSGSTEKTASGRQGGIVSDVYGDWKQSKTSNFQRKNGASGSSQGGPDKQQSKVISKGEQSSDQQFQAAPLATNLNNGRGQGELRSDFSHRTSINRSFSPSQIQLNASGNVANQEQKQSLVNKQSREFDNNELMNQQFPVAPMVAAPVAGQGQSNRAAISGAQTVTSGFFNAQKYHQHQSSSNNLRNIQNNSDLGYQNLNNFQWPRNKNNKSELLLSAQGQSTGAPNANRPQTRDSYFESQGSAGRRIKNQNGLAHPQSMAALSTNTGMMRSTAGPASFNVGQRQKIRYQMPGQQQIGERPSTRQGSDERSPNMGGRPITQGRSRRAIGLANMPATGQISLPTSTIQKHPQHREIVDATYHNNGITNEPGVMNRRTSSRRMNRIYGGGGNSASINRVDSNNAPSQGAGASQLNNQAKLNSNSNSALQTVSSLPEGFDPIFNSNSNSAFVDNSTIKIKPMRLSKGFEQHSELATKAKEVFEQTETSSYSAVSRGTSIGTLESQGPPPQVDMRVDERMPNVGSIPTVSPIYGREGLHQQVVKPIQKIERKRNSKGKVIGASHNQTGHFRKKMTSKNNRETAMESIIEEDENQIQRELPVQQTIPNLTLRDSSEGPMDQHQIASSNVNKGNKPTSLKRGQKTNGGSNGSTTMSSNFQLKNDNELSTMQTSGGFSNTRRSPRDPSFESNSKKDGQLRLRPQLISSQNYNSLHSLRPVDKDTAGSFRPLPGANLTSTGFNNIMEEEEFAYQDEKQQQDATGGLQDRGSLESRRRRKLALGGRGGGSEHDRHQMTTQNQAQLKNRISMIGSPNQTTHISQKLEPLKNQRMNR